MSLAWEGGMYSLGAGTTVPDSVVVITLARFVDCEWMVRLVLCGHARYRCITVQVLDARHLIP